MIISLKKYVKSIVYRFKTKIDIDNDFYDDEFYLIDMEVEKDV